MCSLGLTRNHDSDEGMLDLRGLEKLSTRQDILSCALARLVVRPLAQKAPWTRTVGAPFVALALAAE